MSDKKHHLKILDKNKFFREVLALADTASTGDMQAKERLAKLREENKFRTNCLYFVIGIDQWLDSYLCAEYSEEFVYRLAKFVIEGLFQTERVLKYIFLALTTVGTGILGYFYCKGSVRLWVLIVSFLACLLLCVFFFWRTSTNYRKSLRITDDVDVKFVRPWFKQRAAYNEDARWVYNMSLEFDRMLGREVCDDEVVEENPFDACNSEEEAKILYRKLSSVTHPDNGGSSEIFNSITLLYKKHKDALENKE